MVGIVIWCFDELLADIEIVSWALLEECDAVNIMLSGCCKETAEALSSLCCLMRRSYSS